MDYNYNPMEIPSTTTTTRRENNLQGPRPTPLKVNTNSHKIKKPPKPPLYNNNTNNTNTNNNQNNQPVIIYSVSPKPIFVDPSNFRTIVQRLTGKDPTSPAAREPTFEFSGDAPATPAARLAAMERTSPSEREQRERKRNDLGDEIFVGMVDYDMSAQIMPGILSPSPANLPPAISPGMFSPANNNNNNNLEGGSTGQSLFGVNDFMMSPFMNNYNYNYNGNNYNYNFVASPSGLFFSAAPFVSPTPSPAAGELYNLFDF